MHAKKRMPRDPRGRATLAVVSAGSLALLALAACEDYRDDDDSNSNNNSPPALRCTDCHVEIAWLAERRRGVHGQPGREDCAGCHN